MNAFHIKILAIASMVASHTGIFLLPQYPILILLGNVAFPLFAWLIANGARHSRDLRHYVLRLFAFACISQGPFWLANTLIGSTPLYLNVFFTLTLGLLAIMAIRGTGNRFLHVLAVAGCAVAAQAANADYGAAGVFSIVASYLLFDRIVHLALALAIILVALPLALPYAQRYAPGANLYFDHSVDPFALAAALGAIALYNGNEGPKLKYLFYAFYPLHYLAIYLIRIAFPELFR